jgi:hypothetical protein
MKGLLFLIREVLKGLKELKEETNCDLLRNDVCVSNLTVVF